MAKNASIYAAFERMWLHIVSYVDNAVSQAGGTGGTGGTGGSNNYVIETNAGLEQRFWRGTQAEYDAIETKDESTMYIITDNNSGLTSEAKTETWTFTLEDGSTVNKTIYIG